MQLLPFFTIHFFGSEVYLIPVALDSAQASILFFMLAFAIDTQILFPNFDFSDEILVPDPCLFHMTPWKLSQREDHWRAHDLTWGDVSSEEEFNYT